MNIAIIPARGGSKGIPNKNIKPFCKKPLIYWTIKAAQLSKSIDRVFVSSDSKKILNISEKYGAETIIRPKRISGDKATTESAMTHLLSKFDKKTVKSICLLQPTSPLRLANDIDEAYKEFNKGKYSSLFSGAELEDFLIWKKNKKGILKSINYNYKNRGRRQDRDLEFVENGSIYISKPSLLLKNNRLGGKIGFFQMKFWQTFELDNIEEWKLLEIFYNTYIAKENKNGKF